MDSILLAAFGAMICWGVGDFCMQRSARKMGNIEALTWIGIIGSVGLLPFIIHELSLLSTVYNVGLLVLLGIVTFVAAIFDLEALKIGKISVIDMVISLELPFTIVFGMLFFHEVLTLWQFVLILFLMWGVSFIAVAPNKLRFRFEKGVWLALVAAVLMAGVNFLTALSAKDVSPLMAVWVPWIVFTIICVAIIVKRHGGAVFVRHAQQFPGLILLMGVIDTAAWLFYAYAVRAGELGIITAITESYPAIALLLGVWLNKERIVRHQYVGAGVALAASFFLALTL